MSMFASRGRESEYMSPEAALDFATELTEDYKTVVASQQEKAFAEFNERHQNDLETFKAEFRRIGSFIICTVYREDANPQKQDFVITVPKVSSIKIAYGNPPDNNATIGFTITKQSDSKSSSWIEANLEFLKKGVTYRPKANTHDFWHRSVFFDNKELGNYDFLESYRRGYFISSFSSIGYGRETTRTVLNNGASPAIDDVLNITDIGKLLVPHGKALEVLQKLAECGNESV